MTHYRFAVLGDPVEHSQSPPIHTEMLTLAGLSGEYHRIRADARILADTVEGLRSGTWSGLNVTMPLKSDAAALSDRLDTSAELSGSVNTLLYQDGEVKGYSTDTLAFRAILSLPEFATGAPVLVLGAGGSAAAALAALTDVEVLVAARRRDRAEALCARMGGSATDWGTSLPGGLVINTTPLGMAGESLPAGILEAASGLIDLPYGDEVTPATATARRMGVPAKEGYEFLVRQAVDSFRLWTGADIDVEDLLLRLRNT